MATSERRTPTPPAVPADEDASREVARAPGTGDTPSTAVRRHRTETQARGQPTDGRHADPRDADDGDNKASATTAAEPITGEAEAHSLNRDGQQGVHDRAASKGRRYAFDQNPSGEANDPSLTSGPTRERKI